MTTSSKKSTSRVAVTGKFVTSVPGFVLVGVSGQRKWAQTPPHDRASVLVPKVAQALSKPGISRDAVFKGKTKNVYSYSVDATDTTRVIRIDAAGRRRVGRLVGSKFVPVKAA
jgi:hypothetical protein